MISSLPPTPDFSLGSASGYTWLLLCYCTGLTNLALADNAAADDVAALLSHAGHEDLSHLLRMSLHPQVALICALDMQYGERTGLCIVRTDTSRIRTLDPSLEYSLSLTQLLVVSQRWVRATHTGLVLLPQSPHHAPITALFPSTAEVLAALPGPAGMAPDPDTQQAGMHAAAVLNTVEMAVALETARAERGRGLQVLLAENCFIPSLETAYQLHRETEYLAPVRSQPRGRLAYALARIMEGDGGLPETPSSFLQAVISPPAESLKIQFTPNVWQGLAMGRVPHLYYLCSQFATCTQSIWQEDRNLQTAYLIAGFHAQSADDGYCNLFDLVHKLQYNLHRLSLETVERMDPVLLGQLTECLREILNVQRNRPELMLHPAGNPEASVQPTLSIYLPAGQTHSAYGLLDFAHGGWQDFIHLLHAARA